MTAYATGERSNGEEDHLRQELVDDRYRQLQEDLILQIRLTFYDGGIHDGHSFGPREEGQRQGHQHR